MSGWSGQVAIIKRPLLINGWQDNYFELKSDKMRELEDDFSKNILSIDSDPYNQAWQNVVFQAMISTCVAVFLTLLVVF